MSRSQNEIVQWYPGHMAKAMRRLAERIALIDVVVEVVDARVPRASANPDLDRVAGKRPRLVVLGREDLADPALTRRWTAWYEARGRRAIAVDGRSQSSVARVALVLDELCGSGPARAIVVGIPNTGKSSIINGIVRRAAAKTEERAGVTRTLQWFRVRPMLELMDTPGILVPKIPTPEAMWQLAITGALPRERYDPDEVIARFVAWAHAEGPPALREVPDLETFAERRGFRRRGGEVDVHNAAGAYLKTFGEGGFGRVTFENPPGEPA